MEGKNFECDYAETKGKENKRRIVVAVARIDKFLGSERRKLCVLPFTAEYVKFGCYQKPEE